MKKMIECHEQEKFTYIEFGKKMNKPQEIKEPAMFSLNEKFL